MDKFEIMRIQANGGFTEKRLKEISEKLGKSQEAIFNEAQKYNKKYKDQINDADRLLEDGRNKGLSDKEIFRQHGRFVPSTRTPILNWLSFMLDENQSHEVKEQEDKRKKLDEKYEGDWHTDFSYDNVHEPADMVEFILGNSTLDTFNKIKKLKTLATNNPNPHEASNAEYAGRKLCEKYGLEYDRIPTN